MLVFSSCFALFLLSFIWGHFFFPFSTGCFFLSCFPSREFVVADPRWNPSCVTVIMFWAYFLIGMEAPLHKHVAAVPKGLYH